MSSRTVTWFSAVNDTFILLLVYKCFCILTDGEEERNIFESVSRLIIAYTVSV